MYTMKFWNKFCSAIYKWEKHIYISSAFVQESDRSGHQTVLKPVSPRL